MTASVPVSSSVAAVRPLPSAVGIRHWVMIPFSTPESWMRTWRVIIDRNGLQATGRTADRFRIGSIEDKMRAFGFEVLVIDGHDMQQIAEALDKADEVKEKPVCIIADTVKGKGIPFAEGVAGFHNGTLTQEQYEEALQDLRCVSRTEA